MRAHRIAAALALCLATAMPVQAAVSSGTITIPGTYTFDFDAGVIGAELFTPYDIFWRQLNSTTREVTPILSVGLINLGAVNFGSLDFATLSGLSYSSVPIDGSDIGSVLVAGNVFAVRTDLGNFAKVLVTGSFDDSLNNGLPIQWETLSPVPEPGPLALMAVGLVGVLMLRRRRVRNLS